MKSASKGDYSLVHELQEVLAIPMVSRIKKQKKNIIASSLKNICPAVFHFIVVLLERNKLRLNTILFSIFYPNDELSTSVDKLLAGSDPVSF